MFKLENQICALESNTLGTKQKSNGPQITGGSVIGVRFDDGVVIAADNSGSYGSFMKYDDIERLIIVGKETVVGFGGDISDMQYINRILDDIVIQQDIYDNDGQVHLRAPHVYEYLCRLLYKRRCEMNPLFNVLVVSGFNDDGSPFLKYVNLLGVRYESPEIATGLGAYLAVPILRNLRSDENKNKIVSESDAKKAIHDSMRVLFYRDGRASDKFSMITLKKDSNSKISINFEKDLKVNEQYWKVAEKIVGY